jgi:NAD(P)-dependent dehydrogenase (short-subunit alcohol dehydrogenase family)
MEHDLSGRIAVVVGGGQMPGEGIGNGRAICLNLARHGATVVAAARHLERAQDTVDLIAQDSGGQGWAYEMDVADRAQCARLFADVKAKYGRVDIVVYNVGTTLDFDFATNAASLEAVNRLLDVDFVGWVWCCLEAGAVMEQQEQGGSMVCVSSIASLQNGTGINIGYGFYACAKAAMNKWAELAARHYAPRGIRINTLVLGPVTSIMGLEGLKGLEGGISSEEATKIHEGSVLLRGGRKSTWETGNAVVFLVSDEAKFVTGLQFVLDGGTTIPRGPDPELLQLKIKLAAETGA